MIIKANYIFYFASKLNMVLCWILYNLIWINEAFIQCAKYIFWNKVLSHFSKHWLILKRGLLNQNCWDIITFWPGPNCCCWLWWSLFYLLFLFIEFLKVTCKSNIWVEIFQIKSNRSVGWSLFTINATTMKHC